ncbi:MAG: MFS transporter, partial [Actinomycetota bacterium]|nr:MFS transporter [Actinomycetota bacterium]
IGFTPFATGLLLAPPTLILFLLAARFGRAADRRGPRLLLAVGPALMAAGMLLFLVLAPGSGWPAVLPGMLVLGLGLAMTVAPITATALTSAPDRHSGLAAAINSTISRIGGLIAVAVVGLVIATVFDARTEARDAVALAKDQHGAIADASTDAFRAGILVTAGLAGAGAVVGLLGITNHRRSDRAAAPAPNLLGRPRSGLVSRDE